MIFYWSNVTSFLIFFLAIKKNLLNFEKFYFFLSLILALRVHIFKLATKGGLFLMTKNQIRFLKNSFFKENLVKKTENKNLIMLFHPIPSFLKRNTKRISLNLVSFLHFVFCVKGIKYLYFGPFDKILFEKHFIARLLLKNVLITKERFFYLSSSKSLKNILLNFYLIFFSILKFCNERIKTF